MKCVTCQRKAILQYSYRVQGKRYGMLPGVIRVYVCPLCHLSIHTLELRREHLVEQTTRYAETVREHQREIARLKEKLDWMMRPSQVTERKLKRVRAKAIELMELTF